MDRGEKEVVIMLYVLSQTVGCYAANQLPSSDVQQNGMSDNMLNNQRVVVHKDDISEHAEKSQSMVYVKRFQLDVSGIEECLPPRHFWENTVDVIWLLTICSS